MMKGKIKLISAVCCAFIATQSYAVGAGPYLGLAFGPAMNNASNQLAQVQGAPFTVVAKPRHQQFGSRFFLGYQAYPFVGFEMGVTFISGIHFNTGNVATCNGPVDRVRWIDATGKVAAPFYDWFDVYAKAGVAYVYETTSGSLNPALAQPCGKTFRKSKFAPTFSIGASYNITQAWVTDVSWNRTNTGGVSKSINFYSIGLAYHFVDRYCGQFLCDPGE